MVLGGIGCYKVIEKLTYALETAITSFDTDGLSNGSVSIVRVINKL